MMILTLGHMHHAVEMEPVIAAIGLLLLAGLGAVVLWIASMESRKMIRRRWEPGRSSYVVELTADRHI